MLRVLAIASMTLLLGTGLAFADSSSSPKWIGKRVSLFQKTCLATAPDFGRFHAAALANGFVRKNDGLYSFGQTEIIVSLDVAPQGCDCIFTFGTKNPDEAANRIGKLLMSPRTGRFEGNDDPHSFGVWKTSDGDLAMRLVRFEEFNVPWVGVVIHGLRACPANLGRRI